MIHKDICMQAFNMSKDHKPELKSEKDRIYAAGGYIYGGRVNRTLNLARAIGIYLFELDLCLQNENF